MDDASSGHALIDWKATGGPQRTLAMPAGQSVRSILMLQGLPFFARAVLLVAVSLMGVVLVQPVGFS